MNVRSSMPDRDFRRAKVAFLNALADDTRLEILDFLRRKREATVSQIQAHLGRDQSAVSHHLACLRSCGLVSTRKQGKHVHYSLNGRSRIAKILDLTESHVKEVFESILSCRVVGNK